MVHDALDSVFNGRFMHFPAYSTFLAPIEKGFANIRLYVQDHESDSYFDPIGVIKAAFEHYAVS